MRKYGQAEYRPRDCYCKPRHFPLAVLSYLLGVNKNHPRRRQPWGDLAGKVADHNLARGKQSKPDGLRTASLASYQSPENRQTDDPKWLRSACWRGSLIPQAR